ncbi:MAG: aminoglycoside phosphotransferase [Propionibacteriaceae bacterium]|jgi:hypothetical protein|nr:aminoglycoside phosphotransferase [Propionibacteriaceae bacterium]
MREAGVRRCDCTTTKCGSTRPSVGSSSEGNGADDATWARARGWALTQGLEALPYYFNSHPGMVAMARRVIRATLNSQE